MPQVVIPARLEPLMRALQVVNGEFAKWHSSNYKTNYNRNSTPPELLSALDVLNTRIEEYFRDYGWSTK